MFKVNSNRFFVISLLFSGFTAIFLILNNTILTSQQADFLFDLQLKIDAIPQIIRDFAMTYILERGGAVGGQTPGFCTNGSGKVGGIDYKVYTKEFTAQSRPVMTQGDGRSYYYDMDGYLICVDASYERILGRHFSMLSYLSYATGATLQTTWSSEPESPEMRRLNEQSLKAGELYSYFTP